MAEKRRWEASGSVTYAKLPRLEAKACPRGLGASLPSTRPGYPSDTLYGYQGAYFAYPLQGQDGTPTTARWTPPGPYAHCTAGPAGQQLRAEKAYYPVYQQEREGLGAQYPTPGKGKGDLCVPQEPLPSPEGWAGWTGYPQLSSQASWLHNYMPQVSARGPAPCPKLAAPRPVYQSHVYSPEAGYGPKALGMPAESTPPGTDWALARLAAPESPGYGPGAPEKAPCAEAGFPPGAKHSAGSPTGFVPYHQGYRRGPGVPGGSFLEGGYSAAWNVQEANGECASRHIWSKLPPPPVSPLANATSLMHQERSPAGYPPPPYPRTAHEPLPLYPQDPIPVEKANPLFPLPSCKSFGAPGPEDPQVLPGSYYPPAPVSYHPSLLERYLCSAGGIPQGLLSPREREYQQGLSADVGTDPQLACAAPEKASYCSGPLPRHTDVPRDCREGGQGMDWLPNGGVPMQRSSPKAQLPQPLPGSGPSPHFLSGFGQMPGAGYSAGFPQTEKAGGRDEKGSSAPIGSPGTSGSKTREESHETEASGESRKTTHGGSHQTEAGVSILIPDSPEKGHASPSKRDLPTKVLGDSTSPLQRGPQALEGQSATQRPESPPPPSSPPMPIINNVFSLAPYRDYLEGTSDTVEVPLSEHGQPEDEDSPGKADEMGGTPGSWQGDSVRPPGASRVPDIEGKDPSPGGMAGGSQGSPGHSNSGIRTSDSPRDSESVGVQPCPAEGPASSWPSGSNRTGEAEHDGRALDRSWRREGLADVPTLQKPQEKEAELAVQESSGSKGEELTEGPPDRTGCLLEANWRTSELPLKSVPSGKSHFQSSSAFLYKKFKILKTHAARVGSSPSGQPASSGALSPHPGPDPAAPQQGIPAVPQQSPSPAVTLQNTLPVQRSPHRGATWPSGSAVPQSLHQGVTQQTNLPIQERPQQQTTQQNRSPVPQSSHQGVTQQVQQRPQQDSTRQNRSPVAPTPHPGVTQQTNLLVQQRPQQELTQQNRSPVSQILPQTKVDQSCSPVQESALRPVTQQTSLPVQQGLFHAVAQLEVRFIQFKGLAVRPLDASKALPPSTPASCPVLGETNTLVPSESESRGPQPLSGQDFTALHTSVCSSLAHAVSASSPEQLCEWLKKAEPHPVPKERGLGLAKPKNGLKASSDLPRLSKGKQIWMAFKEVATPFRKLLHQLDTFLVNRTCPFPHVVRAGAIFIPIHVVKEKLFPDLSSASVDYVLQGHKVALRPTTLSEEKLLRDLELKSCTSRLLKLLALKQLPEIYPDLLTLHWHDCVKQQLGDTSRDTLNGDLSVSGTAHLKLRDATTRCLQDASPGPLGWKIRGKHRPGGNWGSATQDPSACFPSGSVQSTGGGTSLELALPALEKGAAIKGGEMTPEEKKTISGSSKDRGPHSGARRRPLANKVAGETTRPSAVLQLQTSVVRIQFRDALRDIKGPPGLSPAGRGGGKMAPGFLKRLARRRYGKARASRLPRRYPELVGKRIRHLYEEKDKSEAWYRGVVLRVHKRHRNPLKTVYEVKYDSEPEWQYYLEILQDYKKGWVELEE